MSNIWATFGSLPRGTCEDGVQASIPRALTYLTTRDQNRFRKKFSEQAQDEHQVMHTFRELLVGVFMSRQGYAACYERNIDGLTPDWHFQREADDVFIADVVNLHVERRIETQIDRALQEGHTWSGEIPDQSQRLSSILWIKAGKYNQLAARKRIPYVVFIFGWREALVQSHQIEECLLQPEGVFQGYPTLSGVYHVDESGNYLYNQNAGYGFDYHANPIAAHPAAWPNGTLPYRFPPRSDGRDFQ